MHFNYDIKDCIFRNYTTTSAGGAIFVYERQVMVIIDSCFFILCTATINGGAVSITSDQLSMSNSFYSKCVCPGVIYGGQSFYVDTYSMNCTLVSMDKCPENLKENGFELLIARQGIQMFSMINSTNNIATHYASGLLSGESKRFKLIYGNFVNNSSPNHILALTHIRPDDILKYVNLVHNNVTEDSLIFLSGSCAVFRNFIIFGNTGTFVCHQPLYGYVYFVLKDSKTDLGRTELGSVQGLMKEYSVAFNANDLKPISFPNILILNSSNLHETERFKLGELTE